jgi:hypothetical protein
MTPTALAPHSAFDRTLNTEDYDAPLPSFVGLAASAQATPADLGALADRAEAGVSALQILFDAEACGAVVLPVRLADQLHLLLDRATGRVNAPAPSGGAALALMR